MRNLRTFDPWRDFGSLQDRINMLFDDTLRGTAEGDEQLMRGAWAPAVDIHESEEGFSVTADLPGVNKEDIKIDLKDNTLTISGEKKFEEKTPKENYIRIERSYGKFVRSFSMPNNIDSGKIKATFKDGTLELIIPKKEEAKPKQITIDVK
jgi:HSP20 family protein